MSICKKSFWSFPIGAGAICGILPHLSQNKKHSRKPSGYNSPISDEEEITP